MIRTSALDPVGTVVLEPIHGIVGILNEGVCARLRDDTRSVYTIIYIEGQALASFDEVTRRCGNARCDIFHGREGIRVDGLDDGVLCDNAWNQCITWRVFAHGTRPRVVLDNDGICLVKPTVARIVRRPDVVQVAVDLCRCLDSLAPKSMRIKRDSEDGLGNDI